MDRNIRVDKTQSAPRVALRKESVDRNLAVWAVEHAYQLSLSARRAWIEITTYFDTSLIDDVALRKESVDRNIICLSFFAKGIGRSPQGERG